MAVVYQDDFSAYTVGSPMPQGLWKGGPGTVLATSPPPGINHCQIGNIYTFGIGTCTAMTITFSLSIGSTAGSGNLLQLFNTNPFTLPLTNLLLTVRLEPDYTISLISTNSLGNSTPLATGGANCNTGVQSQFAISLDTFYYVELDVLFTGLTVVIISATLTISGGIGGCTGGITTNISVPGLFTGVSSANCLLFNVPGFLAGSIANVVVDNTSGAGYPFPSPPANRFGQVNQIVLELIEQATDEVAQVFQFVLEVIEQPSNEVAQVFQYVIELLSTNTGGVGGAVPLWIDMDYLSSSGTNLWTDTEMQ